ncbi:aspartate kinase [Methylopila turkensis]|nr:aspartate kinase [Methylopila turkensis]
MKRRPLLSVVKLGGSLFEADALDALLDASAWRGAVVVAGGGPFADAVRAAQKRRGFDDATAHRMAILAMEQSALMLAARRPDLRPCATPEAFAAARGRGAIWLPARMALEADLPASWDVTSDSLALWLAITLGAAQAVFVKAAPAPAAEDPKTWAESGLVDPYLPLLAARYEGRVALIGDASPTALDQALDGLERRAA